MLKVLPHLNKNWIHQWIWIFSPWHFQRKHEKTRVNSFQIFQELPEALCCSPLCNLPFSFFILDPRHQDRRADGSRNPASEALGFLQWDTHENRWGYTGQLQPGLSMLIIYLVVIPNKQYFAPFRWMMDQSLSWVFRTFKAMKSTVFMSCSPYYRLWTWTVSHLFP